MCDHTVAIVANTSVDHGPTTRVYIHPVKIKVSQLHMLGDEIFREDKLVYCPECGEKIDWAKLEVEIEVARP